MATNCNPRQLTMSFRSNPCLGGFRYCMPHKRGQIPVTATQGVTVPVRITQAIEGTQTVRLKGNLHPLARPEFDQGLVDGATPMSRMLLVSQRSPEQQAALQELMQEQVSKDSLNFHKKLVLSGNHCVSHLHHSKKVPAILSLRLKSVSAGYCFAIGVTPVLPLVLPTMMLSPKELITELLVMSRPIVLLTTETPVMRIVAEF